MEPVGNSVVERAATIGVSGAEARPDRIGTTDGRYSLIRELARGGMGRIWIAEDTKLARRVAVKELLESSGALRARFERELALTSRLEHPAIVGVHDGGAWADGKPFYVMKLVDGESLDRVIARAGTLAERIALLPHGIAAVDAIAYAHAQGIVHRDLKPANVLVGGFGETVVIDWGLAKDLRAATPEQIDGPYRAPSLKDGQTIGGEILGTPAYMPPEQALGDAVDERADVYALGALLYHLLAGAPPHGGTSVDDLLANVISAPPPPLAKRAPGVPPDLVAIIEKAMAREPGDRYATATELAVDLKHFQGGQLVGAHRYTGGQLLRRWLRRHRTAVIVASIAVIALAVVGVISVKRILHEESRALNEERRALKNHAKAERLVSFMLTDLREKLTPLGKLDVLEGIAVEASNYYRDEDVARTPEEEDRRAQALHGVGYVLGTKGKTAEAVAAEETALAIHERLAARDPERWNGELAATLSIVGGVKLASGDQAGALAIYERALALAEKRSVARPDEDKATAGLGRALADLAELQFHHKRDPSAALALRKRELALRQKLVERAKDDVHRLRALAKSQGAVGDMLMHLGDFPGASAELEKSLAIAARVIELDPSDFRAQRLHVDRLEELAGIQHNSGQLAPALARYEQALAIRQRLSAGDPQNGNMRGELGRAHMNLGQINDDSGKLDVALQQHRAALAVFSDLHATAKDNVPLATTIAMVERLIGSLLLRQGKLDEALAQLKTSRTATEALAAKHPQDTSVQRDLLFVYADLAAALVAHEDLAAARELQTMVVTGMQKILESDAKSATAQVDLIDALAKLGATQQAAGETANAAATLQRALTIADGLGTGNPRWDEMRAELRAGIAAANKSK